MSTGESRARGPVRLSHRVDGDPDAPVVVLGASLGTDLRMWDPQVDALARRWRVVRFDNRGHGGSPAPAGPYAAADLAEDVLALLDVLGVDRFGFCGLSLGGVIGQWLALAHPDRVRSLVLCCTAARFGEPQSWRDRAERVRDEGTEWLVEPSRGRWFTPAFGSERAETAERLLTMLRATSPEGYAGCCDALADFDARSRLADVAAPTLVVAGRDDPATPPDLAAELASGIPGAGLRVVAEAAHLASVEQPETVTREIVDHLERTCR